MLLLIALFLAALATAFGVRAGLRWYCEMWMLHHDVARVTGEQPPFPFR